MRSALVTLLFPIGSHPNGSAVLRNEDSNCRRVCRALGAEIPSCLPSARLRFCHQYTARRWIYLLLTGSIDGVFTARGPPDFPPEMTNAMIRSMMEACIMRRRVCNSRLFAIPPSPEMRRTGSLADHLSMAALVRRVVRVLETKLMDWCLTKRW